MNPSFVSGSHPTVKIIVEYPSYGDSDIDIFDVNKRYRVNEDIKSELHEILSHALREQMKSLNQGRDTI